MVKRDLQKVQRTLTTLSISDKPSDGAEDDKYTWDVLCWTLCLLDRCCQPREREKDNLNPDDIYSIQDKACWLQLDILTQYLYNKN